MFKIILHTVSLSILFPLALLSQETVNQETLQDSVVIKNDSMTVATADSLNAFKERFTIYGKAIAGRGLIMAHDDEGNSISTTLSLQEVEDVVEWLPEGHRETPYMEFKNVK